MMEFHLSESNAIANIVLQSLSAYQINQLLRLGASKEGLVS